MSLKILVMVLHVCHAAYDAYQRHKRAGNVTVDDLIDQLATEAHRVASSLGVGHKPIGRLMQDVHQTAGDARQHLHLANAVHTAHQLLHFGIEGKHTLGKPLAGDNPPGDGLHGEGLPHHQRPFGESHNDPKTTP